METKANYAIVGFFTVLVIAAAFGFVYWMANYGRAGQMAPLLVRIPGSANGLSVGSPVRFNGIQVGTVRGLTIDKANPNFVVARTEVRTDAPVYRTTKAILEIQGLTGSAYIELSGGAIEGREPSQEGDGDRAAGDDRGGAIQRHQHPVDRRQDPEQGQRHRRPAPGLHQGCPRAADEHHQEHAEILAGARRQFGRHRQVPFGRVVALRHDPQPLRPARTSTLASVQKLVDAVDPNDIKDIVSNVDETTKQVATASADIDKTLQAFRQTADTYRSVGEKAQKTLDHVDTLIAQLDPKKVGQTVDNITAASAEARKSLAQIARVTARFDKHADDIDQTLTNITEISKKLNAASSRVDTRPGQGQRLPWQGQRLVGSRRRQGHAEVVQAGRGQSQQPHRADRQQYPVVLRIGAQGHRGAGRPDAAGGRPDPEQPFVARTESAAADIRRRRGQAVFAGRRRPAAPLTRPEAQCKKTGPCGRHAGFERKGQA